MAKESIQRAWLENRWEDIDLLAEQCDEQNVPYRITSFTDYLFGTFPETLPREIDFLDEYKTSGVLPLSRCLFAIYNFEIWGNTPSFYPNKLSSFKVFSYEIGSKKSF